MPGADSDSGTDAIAKHLFRVESCNMSTKEKDLTNLRSLHRDYDCIVVSLVKGGRDRRCESRIVA